MQVEHSLTDVEKKYSQTEKEALAIVWSVEHFHLFLYGNQFTLVTDHKPLEVIYGNRSSKPSARIELWVLPTGIRTVSDHIEFSKDN